MRGEGGGGGQESTRGCQVTEARTLVKTLRVQGFYDRLDTRRLGGRIGDWTGPMTTTALLGLAQ